MIRTNAALAAAVADYDEQPATGAHGAANGDEPAAKLEQVLEAVELEGGKYRRTAQNTQITYSGARRSFCAWARCAGIVAVSQVSVEVMNAYVDALRAQGKSASTIALYAGHIRRLIVDAAGLGRADAIDGRLLKWAPRDDHARLPHVRQALKPEEVQRVLKTAERQGLRVLAVVHLALCGLRTAEIAGLTVGDVDVAGSKVRILGKGRTAPEWVSVSAHTMQVINAYMQNEFYMQEPGRAPFENESLWHAETPKWVQCLLRAVLDDAGCSRAGIVPHSFRHTTATVLLANGWPLAKTAQYMRHREPKTTMRYAHDLGGVETAEFLSALLEGPVRTGPAKTGEPARII